MTTASEEQWISQTNSDEIRARATLNEVLSACYLNLYLYEHGLYDKNFTTMEDNDYVEYVELLEKLVKR